MVMEGKKVKAPCRAKKLFYTGAGVEAPALQLLRTRFKKVFGCFFQKALLCFGFSFHPTTFVL
jgi:hypothetical protein